MRPRAVGLTTIMQIATIVFVAMSASFARYLLGPVQETVRLTMGLSDMQMSLLQGLAPSIPSFVLALPLGMLVDRQNRARLLLGFAGLNLAGTILTALAPDFNTLFVARAMVGLSYIAIVMAGTSLVADLVAANLRGRVLMTMNIGLVAGNATAFAAGGSLLELSWAHGGDWRVALMWAGGALAAIPLILLALREPARSEVSPEGPRSRPRNAIAKLWLHRGMLGTLLAAAIAIGTADLAAFVWAAPTFERRFAMSAGEIGWMMGTVLLLSGLAGSILGGFVADFSQRECGARRSVKIMAILILLSVPMGLFAVAPNAPLAGILLATMIMAGGLSAVISSTLLVVVMPNEVRGLSFALFSLTSALLVGGIAPLLVSSLSAQIGGALAIGQALSIVCISASLIAALILFRGARHFPTTPARHRCDMPA